MNNNGTLSVLVAATPAAPPAASAERGTPGGYTARPHTLAERMRFLEREAQAIVARPEAYRVEEIRWAHDMLASTRQDRSIGGSHGKD